MQNKGGCLSSPLALAGKDSKVFVRPQIVRLGRLHPWASSSVVPLSGEIQKIHAILLSAAPNVHSGNSPTKADLFAGAFRIMLETMSSPKPGFPSSDVV
jgi:hypothetical protein